MANSGSENRKMKSLIMVRMEPELEASIRQQSELAGFPLASYVRSILADHIGQSGLSNLPERRDAVLSEMASMCRLVSRMNGAVVQLAKTMRQQESHHHPETESILSGLKMTQRQLVDLINELHHDSGRNKR